MASSGRTYDARRRSRSPDRSYRRGRDERDGPGDSTVREKDELRRKDRDRDVDTGRERDKDRRRSRSRSPRSHRSHHGRSRSRSPRRYSRSPESSHRGKEKEKRKRERERTRSRSRSVSSGDSESDDARRHKRKKDKHRKRSRSRERKERKREKKEKKKKKSAAASSQWGKHGIINDSDFYKKAQEFRTWLLEERKINPEAISKDQEKKEFSKFVEDFNTATLPHEKYYHMEAYERRMSALRSGEYLPPAEDSYDPAMDLKAHSSKHKKAPVEQESYLSKEQLQTLRKVQHERIEAGKMKLLGMDVKTNMGVRMDGTAFD